MTAAVGVVGVLDSVLVGVPALGCSVLGAELGPPPPQATKTKNKTDQQALYVRECKVMVF